MSKRTRPRNLQALERRRRHHARRSAIGIERALMRRLCWDVFGPPDPNPEKLARSIRRRLNAGRALWYEAEYGLPLDQFTSFPGPWSAEREFEGGKMKWRAWSPVSVEVCITPAPIARHIEMSIGFLNARSRAVLDSGTCDACRGLHGEIIQVGPPYPECTSENGCRCLAEKP